jgi:hypothetical protein
MAIRSLQFQGPLVRQLLLKCWSTQSSTKWTKENPAKGQCAVTALVIQDHFGGEIYKTRIDGIWHFYNRIGGFRYDFTAEQFDRFPIYDDILSTRGEAFTDATLEQYSCLSAAFNEALNIIPQLQ